LNNRPFERTITMLKDSANRAGFGFKDGRIEKIVQNSSAARNGILTDHQLLEINGQNVLGLLDKDIAQILDSSSHDVTITVMPSRIFDLLIKGLVFGLLQAYSTVDLLK
jgi:syntenin-1